MLVLLKQEFCHHNCLVSILLVPIGEKEEKITLLITATWLAPHYPVWDLFFVQLGCGSFPQGCVYTSGATKKKLVTF